MRDFLPRHFLPHAITALRHHLQIGSGERLLIAWDETVDRDLCEAFRIAADIEGIEATTLIYSPVAERSILEYGLFAGRSLLEPLAFPTTLRAAIEANDAFVWLGSDTELLFSPDLVEIKKAGNRGIFLPYLHGANAYRMLFRTGAEVTEQAAVIERVAHAISGSQEIRVSSEEGTDLRLRVGEFASQLRTGVVSPGQLLILPAGNVARVPDVGSASGTLVIDRTVCADDYKELHEPIVLDVRDGQVVGVRGGVEAKLLRTFLENLDDERAFHLTELGIGTNPLCKWSGIGAPAEDTHVEGTVAFALGCDTHIGGGVPAPSHVDMTMRFPSLWAGTTQVVADGKLVVE